MYEVINNDTESKKVFNFHLFFKNKQLLLFYAVLLQYKICSITFKPFHTM